MSKIRIGFVGAGFMGQLAHLRNYTRLNDCEVVALAEPRTHLRQLVAEHYGIAKTYPDHRSLLEDCPVDAVVASQPYDRHAVLVPDILDKDVAVFTEKPLALSVESGADLVRRAREKGATYMVGYHKRSDPAMEFAKEWIRNRLDQGCGPIRFVRATMPPGDWIAGGDEGLVSTEEPYPVVDREPPPHDMDPVTFSEYDEFVNYYIHQVNAIRFLLGEPYSVTYASPSGRLLVGESQSGVSVTLEMAPYTTESGWEESYLVGFETAVIRVELPAPLDRRRRGRVLVSEHSGTGKGQRTTAPQLPDKWAMENQAAHFIAAVRGEKKVPCDAAEALEDLRVAKDYIRLKRLL